MKKHLLYAMAYGYPSLRRAYCGKYFHPDDCTDAESEVTYKSCLRSKASWDKARR